MWWGRRDYHFPLQGVGWKMALEIKSGHDDIVRGLGQIAEAKAFGYDSVVLVTSMRTLNV